MSRIHHPIYSGLPLIHTPVSDPDIDNWQPVHPKYLQLRERAEPISKNLEATSKF